MTSISFPGSSKHGKAVTAAKSAVAPTSHVSATQTSNSVSSIPSHVITPGVKVLQEGTSYLAPPYNQTNLMEQARRSNPITGTVKTNLQAQDVSKVHLLNIPQNPDVKSVANAVGSTPATKTFPRGNKNVANQGTVVTGSGMAVA